MADDLVIKGEKYISAKRAAEVSGYKQDYVGQLCRSGKIAATLIGRNWFVSEKSILEHKENIAALILEKKELNKKKIKQTFSFFNQKTISAEESTALNIPLTTTDTSEPKKQNQWFPLEQFIGAPFQEKVLASLILVIVLAGSFFYCNPEKVEGVIATFNRVQDSVSTEASNIAHIILEQGEKIGAAANQSIITTAIATANFGNSLSESVSNLSVIPRALQNTYRKIFVFVSESAHAVAFAVASTFENFQNSLALFAESAAHALAQSQNTVSFVSGDIAARTIEKVITPVQEKIKAAGNNLALFGIRASGAVASTIYGTRDKAFYVVKNIRSRVSAMYTGDSYTDTDVSLKIPADDNNPSSDIKQSMGETYRSNVAFIEKGIVLSITDVVDEFKKVGTRTKEIWNTVLARENNKDGENTSKNLTDTFTSNTSNNITPHFKAFIWKPSFQVELPKLPKLSSLQLPNWELPNWQWQLPSLKTTLANVLNKPQTLVANIFGGMKNTIDDMSYGIYTGINNLVYGFFYEDVQIPTSVVQNTPPEKETPKVAIVATKEPQTTTIIERIIVEKPAAATAAASTASPTPNSITTEELERRLQELNNKLSAQIYSISASQGVVQYFSPTLPQPVQLSQKIDQLSGTTITSPSITGGSWTTADILSGNGSFTALSSDTFSSGTGVFNSDVSIAGNLTVSATATTTFTGDIAFDSNTLYIDSINNRIGIASSSPSDTLSIDGPVYLSQITAPAVTTDRIYNVAGDAYWNGNLIGSASIGNWTASGDNVYRTSGNVGIGTTSPYAKLSVVGEVVAEYFTATSTETASTFPYASTTALTVSGSAYGNTILADTGTLTLGGTGGTNNENITFDFESTANKVYIDSPSGAAALIFSDGFDTYYGTGQEVKIGWKTYLKDSLQIATGVGSDVQTGYVSLVEWGDMDSANRSPSGTSADPVFRVYSSDATQANDYIEMYHDQTNGIISAGSGNITLKAAGTIIGVAPTSGAGNFISFRLLDDGLNEVHRIRGDTTQDQLTFSTADVSGNQFIITSDINDNNDHDHPTQTNPTLYVHSDLSPNIDNTEWLSFTHTSTSTEANNLAYGLIDSGSDKLVLMPGGTVGIGTTTIMSANGSTGVLTLGGTGGTNNEALVIDFETNTDRPEISSNTGATRLSFSGIAPRMNDDLGMNWGAGDDFRILWDTPNTNDSVHIGVDVAGANNSGYVSLMEDADVGIANRSPSSTSADPVFRVYSSDATQANDYIEMYHDQIDGQINSGGGGLSLNSATGQTIFKDNGTNSVKIFVDTNYDQTLLGVFDVAGNHLVLTTGALIDSTKDYDHPVQTNPTLYIHSDTDPDTDNTQWLSFSHDQTDAVIDWGKGNLSLASSTATTTIAGGFDVASGGLVYDRSTGNVGVGTAVPGEALDVNGNIRIRGSNRNWDLNGDSSNRFTIGKSGGGGVLEWDDSDNHFYFDTWDVIVASNVGIGTTSPWANLSVNQDAGEVGFAIGSSTATSFVVDASGNVGVGTDAPNSTLTVAGNNNPDITIKSDQQAIVDGTDLGGIQWSAYDTSGGATRVTTAKIMAQGREAWDGGTGARHSGLAFQTMINAVLDTRMVIDGNGNLGIGTTSPYAKLSVVGETVAEYFTATSTTATSTFYGGFNIGTTTYASANGSTGVLTLGGTGGTNNENLTLDFEGMNNTIVFSTNTGATFVDYGTLGLRINDGIRLAFGNSNDFSLSYTTTGNDNLQMGIGVGSVDQSGYISIMDKDDRGNANRSPSGTSANPVLRVYSSDEAQANDYIEMYHDQANSQIKSGAGGLVFSAASGWGTKIYNPSSTLSLLTIGNAVNSDAFTMRVDTTADQMFFALHDEIGNQIIITNIGNQEIDHDHTTQTNPTLYVHSDTNPDIDNTEWLSFTHTSTSTEANNLAYGLIDSGSDKLVLMPGGTVGIGTTTIMSANGSTGVLTIGGTGGTNNENLTLDFESITNTVEINTTTGASKLKLTGHNLWLVDDHFLQFGGGEDLRFVWETRGNDSLQIGTNVGAASASGYVSIMEKDDLDNANRSPSGTSADPVLRVYSSDAAQADDYIEMYHNQNDGIISVGSGNLNFQYGSTFNMQYMYLFGSASTDELVFGLLDSVGNQLVLANSAVYFKDFDHTTQTNPTLYVHSDTNPDTDNTQWLSFTHDQTDAVIDWGKGNLSLASSTATTTIAGGFNVGSGGLVYDRSTGNVGVGTDAPGSVLTIDKDADVSLLKLLGHNGTTYMEVSGGGSDDPVLQMFIGKETRPSYGFVGDTDTGMWHPSSDVLAFSTSQHERIRIDDSGNVGIGTTSPWRTLSAVGTVGFSSSLTTGTGQALNIDSTTFEVLRNTSSGRYKRDIATIEIDTSDIYNLIPRSFTWNEKTGNEGLRDFGLIAEEVYEIIPKLAWLNASGTPEAVRYDMLPVLMLNELQKIHLNLEAVAATASTSTPESQSFAQNFFTNVFSRITEWFADAANGVGDVFAETFRAKEQICIDDECLTKEDIRSLLALARNGLADGGDDSGEQTPPDPEEPPSEEETSDTTPPTITIQGNNPATIEIGTTYVDLGALITDDQDENPTTYTYLNGATTTNVSIDTSEAGTHTVTYTATDDAGNTASADRTVIVGDEDTVADADEGSNEGSDPDPEPEDTTPPTITLIGEAQVTITEGETYVDLGATATDPVTTDGSEEPTSNGAGDTDGDLTASIITNSTVDTTTPGTYQVTYNVSDAAGNEATEVTRVVVVADADEGSIEAAPVTDPEEPPAEEDDDEESEPDSEPDPDPDPEPEV